MKTKKGDEGDMAIKSFDMNDLRQKSTETRYAFYASNFGDAFFKERLCRRALQARFEAMILNSMRTNVNHRRSDC